MNTTEIRNAISKIFGGAKSPPTTTYYKMLNEFTPTFSDYSGDIYDHDICRTCIHAIAAHAGKLKPRHIRRVNGKITNTESTLDWMLRVRPNPYMNGYQFIYKTVSQLYSNNNAYVYIQTDAMGRVTGLFPINFATTEMVEYQGDLYVKFLFKTGFQMTVPYTELIHLRRHFNRDDIFGDDQRRVFRPTLSLIQTINQGIINTIKSSARIRGLLKFSSVLRPEDMKAQRDAFVADYLGISNDGGIAATDSKAEFISMDPKAVATDDKTQVVARENAYRYFGVSDSIVQGKYTEDEFNAFYSAVLEPIAIDLSLEFTAKVFTDREIGHGNEVIFSASRLTFASNQTKVNMAKELLPLGMLTINETREVFELEPVEGGDMRIISLNYVDASKQNEYQLNEKPKEKPKEVDGDANKDGA